MAPSNNPLIGFGLPLKEPKLYDVLQAFKSQMLASLNCVKVGQIIDFDGGAHTATIQILFRRVLADGSVSSYPKLLNCPVFTLQGGGASLQFPIAAGDQCIVLFSDRNLDAWYQNGGEQAPLDGRLHDLSDGIALVGLNFHKDTRIPVINPRETRLILPDGTTYVGLKSGKITVQNVTGNLLTILQQLITGILGATAGGNPVVDTSGNLAAANSALGNLLY
jgi:hypothetical protein